MVHRQYYAGEAFESWATVPIPDKIRNVNSSTHLLFEGLGEESGVSFDTCITTLLMNILV